MNEKNTINYLKSLGILNNLRRFSGSPDLYAIKAILKYMGNFQNNLNIIHITGTNGKGSTLRFLEQAYLSAGYKVGVFTSPQILKPNEHIRIDGNDISDSDFSKCLFKIDKVCQKLALELSYFEMLTMIALVEMHEKKVDIALVEVGIGTELDSTNVFERKTTVFTKIGVDHERLLGHSPEEVALSKSKLITRDGIVVVGENSSQITNILEKKAMEMNCKFYTSKNLKIPYNITGYIADYEGGYQAENIRTALSVVEALKDFFPVDYGLALEGIKNSKLPLRLEWVNDFILIDSAHNISGIRALQNYIEKQVRPKKITTLFAVLSDKKPEKMLAIVREFSDEVILTKAVSDRAYDFSEMEIFFSDYRDAINFALKKHKDEVIVVCGSFYLTTHAKEFLLKKLK